MEVGLTLASSDIDKLCFRGELGAELVGNAVLYNTDIETALYETKVYERFNNSDIAVNAFVSTDVQAECGPWGISYSLPWNLSYNIRTWDVVPKFKTVTHELTDQKSTFKANATILGDCLMPVEIGFSLRDTDGKEVASYYSPDKFKNGEKSISCTFNNLSETEQYKLNPKIKIFGYEMLASESVETSDICPDDNHPHWIDLGLPSGTLWACCNQGASKPEDYGGHYTQGQADSAPTQNQFDELMTKTINGGWEILNGVNGLKITGPNGNSIFFPAAGDSGEDGDNHSGYSAYYMIYPNRFWHWRWGVYSFTTAPCSTCRNSVRPVR